VGIDRLTGPDLSGFGPDRFGWPSQIGLIAVLEGGLLVDCDGQLRLDDVRERISGRLELAPRLRQVVHRPAVGLGRPIWVDAKSFNIADHIRAHPLSPGASQTELLDVCEELRQHPLDPSHPTWELWLLPGLTGGQVGMFARLHHSIADGPAGIELLSNLLDRTPDSGAPAAPQWTPRPSPSSGDLIRDNIRHRATAVARAGQHLMHPTKAINGIRRTWPLIGEFASEQRVPRTSLNAPIGSARRMAVVTSNLAAIRRASHAAEATVNDAVLTVVANGLRVLLESRGESVGGVVLQAMEPVTLPDRAAGPVSGNRYGVMVVPLPIDEPNLDHLLRRIAAETAPRKLRSRPAWGTGVFGSLLMQRLTLPLASRQHILNIHVANVRGPAEPLYLAGARLMTAFPMVPLTGNLTIGIGALSYVDQLTITVVADRDRCPDLAIFTDGLTSALSQLSEGASGSSNVTQGST
jgi:diacylglycerol O-acyltransferase / wax synthase